MKKLFTIAAVTALITGCFNGEGPATSKHSGKKYYPVKVCSIGDATGESCVEYASEYYCNCDDDFSITTLDGHKYEFNKAGWSIILTKK